MTQKVFVLDAGGGFDAAGEVDPGGAHLPGEERRVAGIHAAGEHDGADSCEAGGEFAVAGLAGAAAATIGIILPSFCIIFLISAFLDNFLEIAWVAHAFIGIKLAVGILILDAAVKMIVKMPKKPIPIAIMGGAFCATMLMNFFAVRVSSITLMLIAAIISLSIFLAKRNDKAEGKAK